MQLRYCSHFDIVFRSLILLICIFFLSSFAFSQAVWTYKGEKNHIKGYTRFIPKGIELKYNATVEVGKNAFIGVLKDVKNYHKWMTGIQKSTLLQEKANPLEIYYYSVVPFPWPLTSRDAVMVGKVKKSADKKTLTISLRPSPTSYPLQKDHIRMTTFEMDVTLVSISPQKTQFEALIRIGEDDGVPMWLANWLISSKFFEVIHNLCQLAVKEPYKSFTHISLE